MMTAVAAIIHTQTIIREPHTILRRATTRLRFTTRSRTATTQQFRSMDFTMDITHRSRIITEVHRHILIVIEALTDDDGRRLQGQVEVQ
jgi:hypothetical protein